MEMEGGGTKSQSHGKWREVFVIKQSCASVAGMTKEERTREEED